MQSVERFRISREVEDELGGQNGNVDEYNPPDSDDRVPYRRNKQVESCRDDYVILTIHVEKHERHSCLEWRFAIDQSHWPHPRCLPSPLSQKARCSSLQEAKMSDYPKTRNLSRSKNFQLIFISIFSYQKGVSYTINFAIISTTKMSLNLKIWIISSN